MLEILICVSILYLSILVFQGTKQAVATHKKSLRQWFFRTILNRGEMFGANTYAVGSGADLEFTIFVTRISVAPTSSSL